MDVPAAAHLPDAERATPLLLDLAFGFPPRRRLRRREDALAEVPEPLLAGPPRDGDLAARLQDLEHQAHLARAPPAMRLSGCHELVLELPREQRSVPLELAQQVTAEAGVLLQEVPDPAVPRRVAEAPPLRHSRADERQVLDRPDERVPLEELSLLPQQPVELGGVVGPEPAEEHELLRGRDRRDRVHLEEAEVSHRVEDRHRGAVEELRAHRDSPCLLHVHHRLAHADTLPLRA